MTTFLRLNDQEYAFNNPDDEWRTRQKSTKRRASDEEDGSDQSCPMAMDTTSDESGQCSYDQKDRTKKHCKYMIGNRVLNILMKADQDASNSNCEDINKEQRTSNEVILSGGDGDVLQEDRECVNCSQIIEVMMDGEPYMDQSIMMFQCEFCDKDVCSECALECGICHHTFCRFCAIQRYNHDTTAVCFSCHS